MSAPPNILLITTDQQRYDTILPFRPDFLRTPHLDDLARKGTVFRKAYSTCPLCIPARCTIMSGQHAWTHRMFGNQASSDALDSRRTLPSRLREQNYQTQAIGKMHFGPPRARHGFDDCLIGADYFRDLQRRGLPHEFHHGLGANEFYPGMASVPEPQTYTSWIAEQCVEFLHERRDPTRPFFLWCSFGKPHPPFAPPEPYYSMYRDAPIPEPAIGDWAREPEQCPTALWNYRTWANFDQHPPELVRAIRQAYYGLITQVDYNLGRVFGALVDQDLFRETMIVFTSDHGEYLGDHQLMGKGHWLDAAAHVPMIVKPPLSWGMDFGQQRDELVCLEDLLPTFVAAAGSSQDADDVDGADLLATVRGDGPARTYLEGCGSGDHGRAITDGRWKYIHYFEGSDEQLFDLESDPAERCDLAGVDAHRDERDRLRDELIRRLAARAADAHHVRDGQFVASPPRPAETEAARRAGYWIGYFTEHRDDDIIH